jgi:hypothetical protein
MLDVLTDQQLRARLANAPPEPGSMVFIGSDVGMMLRGDVENFLRERQEKAAEAAEAERQRDEAQRQREQKSDKAQRRRDILQGVSIGIALSALVWAIASFLLKS